MIINIYVHDRQQTKKKKKQKKERNKCIQFYKIMMPIFRENYNYKYNCTDIQ